MKRILASLLAFATLISLAACAGDTSGSTTTTSADDTTVADTTVAETTTEVINWKSSDVPQDADLEGFNLKFVVRTPSYDITLVPWYLIDTEEQNGEVLNDAVYTRNRTIEEALNCDISHFYWTSSEEASGIPNSILADDHAFEAILTANNRISTFIGQDILLDLYTVPYMDLEREWWDQDMVRDLTINDKLFQITGDINASINIRSYAMMFNKDLADDLGVEYPYQKVRDGQWTREYLENYAKGINSDLNGDGIMDDNDRWGFLSESPAAFHFYIGWGGRVSEIDSDGMLTTTIENEKNVSRLVEAMEIVTDKEVTLLADGLADELGWPGVSAWYMDNGALLRSASFETIPRDYRKSDTDFGVLPFPKFDESQDKYITTAAMQGYVIAIPVNCSNLDSTGMILEALAAESTNTVAQALYDVCLDGKSVRDEESADMIDIIFDNKVFDIAYMWTLGDFGTVIFENVNAGKTDVSSVIAAKKSMLDADIKELNEIHE